MIGLSTQEAKERYEKGLYNEEVGTSTRSVKEICKDNILTYFNLLFSILALLLIIVGSFKDLSFLVIVVANTVIGIVQELRSKSTLDKLKLVKAAKVRTIRDGNEVLLNPTELVIDDVIILTAGNQIPADAMVLDGDITVNESLLTGEADEISKPAGYGLLSGSFVISGRAIAKLTAVGRESFSSKLTIEATKENRKEQSELIKSLDILVKIVGIIIIPIGITLFVQHYFILKQGFASSVASMVAAVLGMIPDGLYLMASIAMAVSVMRLAKGRVLVQSMKSIEALARVDVLCIDKTGTITEPSMVVSGYKIVSDSMAHQDIVKLIGDLVYVQSADNITMEALKAEFIERGGRQAKSICPFSSLYKYCSALFEDCNVVLGAPEYVLGSHFRDFEEYIEEESGMGHRVVALVATEEETYGNPITGRVLPLAVISLFNPVREAAPKTFEYFMKNGVDIKVISGDNPITVSNVAISAGVNGAEKYIDAQKLKDENDIIEAVENYTVFGRVTPEQKRAIVKALQKSGKKVAMTGDGVNDILAMKEADCSVAMASGSEATSNAAQMVLLDSDFSIMPSIVAEGRRLVNNIENTAALYLSKNVFSLLLALFSVFNLIFYPLKPSQITLISMFTIGFPSFILALEPNSKKIKGKFFTNVFKVAAPAGITTFISVSALLIFSSVFSLQKSPVSTASALLVALVGFMILIRVSQPMNKIHVAMTVISFVGLVYCAVFKSSLFGIDPLNSDTTMLLIVFLFATEALYRYINVIISSLNRFLAYLGKRYVESQQE